MVVFLDLILSFDAQVSEVARNAFVQFKLVHELYPFIEMSYGDTCLSYIYFGLLQHALCRTAYEECSETLASSKCCSWTANWSWLQRAYNSLITDWLPVCFQAQFKVLIITNTQQEFRLFAGLYHPKLATCSNF